MATWREDVETEFGKEIYKGKYGGEVIPTGSFILDYLTEIGGFPLGRICEIFGSESSGKTTLALAVIREAFKQKRAVMFEDFEHTLSDPYLLRVGLNPKKLDDYRVMPRSMEEGWTLARRFCERPEHRGGLIVIDSLAAMPVEAELKEADEQVGSTRMGIIAQVMSNSLRQMVDELAKSNVCLLILNQERSSISLKFGGSKTTTGGKALRFYAAVRVQLSLMGSITEKHLNPLVGKKDDEVVAIQVGVNVVKNKFGRSYRRGMIMLRLNEGIDNMWSAVKIGEHLGIVSKRGAYYVLPNEYARKDDLGDVKKLGYVNLRKYFKENSQIWYKYRRAIQEALYPGVKK